VATSPAKSAAPRASSILSQAQTAKTAGSGVKPMPAGAPLSISTKPWVTLRRADFNTKDMADPERLYQVLTKMQEAILSVLGVVVTNQMVPGNIIRTVTFTSNSTQMLAHGLGRSWQGYVCIRAQAGSGAPAFTDVALASGLTNDIVLPLHSANAGTYDIYVF
jgi:hypothetical protein